MDLEEYSSVGHWTRDKIIERYKELGVTVPKLVIPRDGPKWHEVAASYEWFVPVDRAGVPKMPGGVETRYSEVFFHCPCKPEIARHIGTIQDHLRSSRHTNYCEETRDYELRALEWNWRIRSQKDRLTQAVNLWPSSREEILTAATLPSRPKKRITMDLLDKREANAARGRAARALPPLPRHSLPRRAKLETHQEEAPTSSTHQPPSRRTRSQTISAGESNPATTLDLEDSPDRTATEKYDEGGEIGSTPDEEMECPTARKRRRLGSH